MKMTKQTTKGEAIIEVTNGTATATLNGRVLGSSGMLRRFDKPLDPAGRLVAGICGIALTAEEAAEIEKMLATRERVVTQQSGPGIFSSSFTAEVRRAGDINKFSSKGGVI